MSTKRHITRCPECNRIGTDDSAGLKNLCKACVAYKTCAICGEPAFKYFDKPGTGYHSWYCEKCYNEKLIETKVTAYNPFPPEMGENLTRGDPAVTMGSEPLFPIAGTDMDEQMLEHYNEFGIFKDKFDIEE